MLTLADPNFDKPAPVDMLLGADIFPQIWNEKNSSLGPGFPSVYSSVFGWVLIGPVQEHPDIGAQSMLVSSIESIMEKFWKVEEPETAPPQFTEDGMCEELFQTEMRRDSQGSFSVSLPFRSGRSSECFPGSRQVALNCLLQLERKLSADQTLYNAYRKFMQEYEKLGHMSIIEGGGQYYILHHAVQKVEGEVLKLRVVFDASAKCHSGVSLNQCLLVGPKLQQDIVDVLIGFRVHKVAFTTDICKMYRQIGVLPQYRGCQYILWRDTPQVSVKEYVLNTVTYGVNSAPYLAFRVLRYIADMECEGFPDVKNALYNQTYIDDICVGAGSVEAAKSLQSNLIDILARSGLQLKKWASNTPELLSQLQPEDCSGDPLAFEQDNATQVLGMRWNHGDDYFSFSVNNFKMIPTKRGVLSMIARIFDPLGLLAPTIFYAKTIMQRLRQLINHPDQRDKISGYLPCAWHFNPPGAPHFGGIWETAVKSAKSLLLRTMNAQIWTLEEITTVLCRVEAALNSRPLVPASSDPNDLECLTPGHFLIGRPLLSIPDPESPDTQLSLRTHWKLLQQSFWFFWRRWSQKYLNTLQTRGKWTKSSNNLEVGNMEVVKTVDSPPHSWPLGRVIEVYPGTDQIVRVAKVITSKGVFTRPVVKLVSLPTD
ncbi:Integrase catalytic domain-containing protein, partial [Aphis craccivora]